MEDKLKPKDSATATVTRTSKAKVNVTAHVVCKDKDGNIRWEKHINPLPQTS